MDFYSETQHGPDGSHVEVATVVHNGRSFTNLGATFDASTGRLFAYVSGDGKNLTDWEGAHLGVLHQTGTVDVRGFGGFKTRLFCYRALVDGVQYHGRGLGRGMYLKLRRCSRQQQQRKV